MEQLKPIVAGKGDQCNCPCLPCFPHLYPHTPWSLIFECTIFLVHLSGRSTLGVSCSVLETGHRFHLQNAPTLGGEKERKIEGRGPVVMSVHTEWAPDVVGPREGILKFVGVKRMLRRERLLRNIVEEQWCTFEIWWAYGPIIATNTNHVTFLLFIFLTWKISSNNTKCYQRGYKLYVSKTWDSVLAQHQRVVFVLII